ncbi:hypothetical protein KOW79_005689 [Hemibagrus wyckioides]|uniref:Uncharacterized protein n=1 Tax=Hemibagrus wyckioides TaxID=337641 RepID=A0A9D3NZ96_9TELE|nr:hypothetical protein KOW79_005689 [Hemibagrus wyckioides]
MLKEEEEKLQHTRGKQTEDLHQNSLQQEHVERTGLLKDIRTVKESRQISLHLILSLSVLHNTLTQPEQLRSRLTLERKLRGQCEEKVTTEGCLDYKLENQVMSDATLFTTVIYTCYSTDPH